MPSFAENLEIGKIGEKFITSRIHELFPQFITTRIEKTSLIMNNEGCDIHIDAAVRKSNLPDNCLQVPYEQRLDEQTTQDQWRLEGTDAQFPKGEEHRLLIVSGFIEVKTITINQYLTRNDNLKVLNGTIPFEIWKNANRSSYGSLLQMFYPEEHERVAAQPMFFAYVLLDANNRVYACIIFERFNAFKTRLIELAGREGLDLAHPDRIPMNDKQWCPEKCRLKQNTWHVALEEISDLMTVFMVGDNPVIIDDNGCPLENIKARLERLKALSDGRHISNKDVDDQAQLNHHIKELLRNVKRPDVPEELMLQKKPRKDS
ncbi:MAG: hypothetical protein K5919_05050 [Clostridiales bacterium]|nr:hypothetical protein [Clostridiales bacterium]